MCVVYLHPCSGGRLPHLSVYCYFDGSARVAQQWNHHPGILCTVFEHLLPTSLGCGLSSHVSRPIQALTLEADRVFKRTVKEDHDFNEFQQQREKVTRSRLAEC